MIRVLAVILRLSVAQCGKLGFEGTAFCLSGFGGRLGLDVIIRQRDRCNARVDANDGEPPQCATVWRASSATSCI